MIVLYSGTPGSGKSYHAVALVLRTLGWGRLVIANFALTFTEKQLKKGYDKRFYYMENEQININNLVEFALEHEMIEKKKESQCLVVIDEAGGRFNCREYGVKDRREWIDFFSQHRKLGFDFILVAQNDRMLDRQIRGYIETEKKHRKCNNFGPFALLPFPFFVAVEYWYTAKLRVASEFMIFRKKIAEQYDSMKMFNGFTLSAELLKRIEAKRTGIMENDKNPEGFEVSINAIYGKEENE
ncbi:MAG: Zonular occludens toxin (Zot) [Pelotomaculum sp. PtaU1.Bin035]|nr:MAG: Zonular occludens toxin (Zot) [Pelotomaculum sp. PtaU1.Bin035]